MSADAATALLQDEVVFEAPERPEVLILACGAIAREVLAVIRDLAATGWTLMIVTHEIRFARDVADQVLFLDGGVIAERGGAEVLTDPREERTRQFLSRVLEAG